MKDIHYLFYITLKIYFVIENVKLTLIYRKMQFCFDRAVFRSKVTAVYHCTVLFNDRWMVYLFHIKWPCIIQSNDKNLRWCYINANM